MIAADQHMVTWMDIIDQAGMLVVECTALGSVMIVCCRCIDIEYVKTLVTEIQYSLSDTMTGEGEVKRSPHGRRRLKEFDAVNPRGRGFVEQTLPCRKQERSVYV